MSRPGDIDALTLAGIAHRCAQETERFFQRQSYDPRYCFELFRRAIEERVEQAWSLVYAQYRSLVAGWVERHSAFGSSGEEVQYFVNRAFEKMWLALTPARFADFPDLKSLLRYLQMCVHSAILDLIRARTPPLVDAPAETLAPIAAAQEASVEDEALDRVRRQDLWQEVTARLHDEKERRVVYGMYALGLKPREVYEHYRDTFRDVSEVYRVKENVLARLRRDPSLVAKGMEEEARA